jgi:hypothetical protein
VSTSVRVGQTLPETQNEEGFLGGIYVPELSVDKLTSGEINAATITMGDNGRIVIGVDTRIELNQMGLYATKDGQPIFKLDKDGLEITGKVNSIDGTFTGRLEGATIANSTITAPVITGGVIQISGTYIGPLGLYVGGVNAGVNSTTAPFRVSTTGVLTAEGASISGTISGSSIVGSTISAGEGNFTVNALGVMTAKGATLTDATLAGTTTFSVPAPVAVTFTSTAMTHYDGTDATYGKVKVSKSVDGTVSILGNSVTNATIATAVALFTLPTGYRPTKNVFATIFDGVAVRRVQITSAGVVNTVTAMTSASLVQDWNISFNINNG